MKNPRRSLLGWASEIKNEHFDLVVLRLLVYYLGVNLIFSIVHYGFKTLNTNEFFDYVYFSFVTSLSIGYGDLVPLNIAGKILVIAQTCVTALYFALMVSILSIKIFYPRDTVLFSEKVIYNPKQDVLIIRVININRDTLVNPDIRISVTEHNTGNESAGMINIPIDYELVYLGKYDFSYTFKNTYKTLNVLQEANKALEYNEQSENLKSRFRINISLTGSYGFKQIALYKKYYAKDIVMGSYFKPITYNKKFYKKNGNIKYNKIKNYWEDFESVEKLQD